MLRGCCGSLSRSVISLQIGRELTARRWYIPRPSDFATEIGTVKADIHPEYRKVLFHDTTSNTYFLVNSTAQTSSTHEYEGETYPYMTIDVSSASHPFYTGKQKVMDTGGRIDRFQKRFGSRIGGKKD